MINIRIGFRWGVLPLHFTEAVEISRILPREKKFASQACQQTFDAFRSNVERALGALIIPGFAQMTGSLYQTATNRAADEILGREHKIAKTPANIQEIGNRTTRYFSELMNANASEQLDAISKLSHNFEHIVRPIPVMRDALESLLKSVVVQGWMSFEVMAGDLWERVINEHPFKLAGLNGKPKRKDRASNSQRRNLTESQLQQSKQEGKIIPLSYLERHNYDLSKQMGTVLRTEKCNFIKLSGIREAYFMAFAEDYHAIDLVLNDECLDALSGLRHVLVHKGGLVDEEFHAKTTKLQALSALKGLNIGDPILVDGLLVVKLFPPLVKAGSSLILAVSEWLEKHPAFTDE